MEPRKELLRHLAPTSDAPLNFEVDHAKGVYIYSPDGSSCLDLISGISVANTGHAHPKVTEAIKAQAEKFTHVMVYGEYVQSPQGDYAKALTSCLPQTLNTVYFVNSGSEAVEGALKLAKRATGRHEILAFNNAYHGSTHGALSVMGDERLKQPYRPLLPGISHAAFNDDAALESITEKTAAVIVEPIQGEAGVRVPKDNFLTKLREKCDTTGTLLMFDEIQTGFGRTGSMFALEKYNVIPDVLILAKSLGGGLPLGAFIADYPLMEKLALNPVLGHITTFGGHPLSCAAGKAALDVISDGQLPEKAIEKGGLFKDLLRHTQIKELRGEGLFMAIQLESFNHAKELMHLGVKHGFLTDWFLFCDNAVRLAPPLVITKNEIETVCEKIITALDQLEQSL